MSPELERESRKGLPFCFLGNRPMESGESKSTADTGGKVVRIAVGLGSNVGDRKANLRPGFEDLPPPKLPSDRPVSRSQAFLQQDSTRPTANNGRLDSSLSVQLDAREHDAFPARFRRKLTNRGLRVTT